MELAVNYAELTNVADLMASQSKSIVGELQSMMSDLNSKLQWEGEDAMQYRDTQRRMNEAVESMSQLIEALSKAVHEAHGAYAANEAAGRDAWG